MGGEEEEEEWNNGGAFVHPLQLPPMEWSATGAVASAPARGPDNLLRIRFQSRDYSLRQFSETVLDAEAMIQIFAVPFSWSPRPDWAMHIREQLSERIGVRTVSLSSPLEVAYVIAGTAVMTAVTLNRWISLRKNWQNSRLAKADADRAITASKVASAEADRDVAKAEVEKLAWGFVKQHLENESKKDFDSLPPKHPLRELATRAITAMVELETVATELSRDG